MRSGSGPHQVERKTEDICAIADIALEPEADPAEHKREMSRPRKECSPTLSKGALAIGRGHA